MVSRHVHHFAYKVMKTSFIIENFIWQARDESECLIRNLPFGIMGCILQPYRHFTYVTTHSPSLPSLYLSNSSFSNTSVASSTSQFILQPFFRFSYVTSSSLNSPAELSSFSNFSVALPTSQLILQPFCCFTYVCSFSNLFRHFTYVTTHSPTLLLLHLSQSSFSNPSFASPRHKLFT